jgi:hypothetical protein
MSISTLGECDAGNDIEYYNLSAQLVFLEKRNDFIKISKIYENWLTPNRAHLLNLKPTYQRELVWEYEGFIKFLDSVHRNYIFNPIILCKLNNFAGGGPKMELDKYECLDGQHRLTCIRMYMNGECYGDEYLYILHDNTRLFYKETQELNNYIFENKRKKVNFRYMNEVEKETFDNIEFSFQIITTDLNKQNNFKAEIFNRIQNGARVSTFEIIKNMAHPLCIYLRENVLVDKIFKYQLFEKIVFYQRVNTYNIIQNIKNSTKNELYLYFLIRLFYIYQNKTLSFGHFDMNLNIKKKLDDELIRQSFSNCIQEYEKIWHTIKIIIQNVKTYENTVAEPLYYYLFYSFNFDYPIYKLLNQKINCKKFMSVYNNISNARKLYVASNKLKSNLILETYDLIKKDLCGQSHIEKTPMPVTKNYSFSK